MRRTECDLARTPPPSHSLLLCMCMWGIGELLMLGLKQACVRLGWAASDGRWACAMSCD
mgnify:CR=1 FL=1